MNEIETGLKQGKKKVRFELIALGKSNLFKLEIRKYVNMAW